MIAWEWMLDKARDGDEDKGEKKAARKISQTAQVRVREKQLEVIILINKIVVHGLIADLSRGDSESDIWTHIV